MYLGDLWRVCVLYKKKSVIFWQFKLINIFFVNVTFSVARPTARMKKCIESPQIHTRPSESKMDIKERPHTKKGVCPPPKIYTRPLIQACSLAEQ